MNSINENTTDTSVNAVSDMNYNAECKSDYDNSHDKMVASIASNTLYIEPKKNDSTNWKHKSGPLNWLRKSL